MDNLDRAWARAALMASLEATAEPGLDDHEWLLRALRAAPADPGPAQGAVSLSARLADHLMQAQALRSRAAARYGLAWSDVAARLNAGQLRSGCFARAGYDVW